MPAQRHRGTHDVVVLGVGAMGSAAAYHLATRGEDVLALEQFDVPNAKGSSHGGSRVLSSAYYADPAYQDLCGRALALWRDLDDRRDCRLYHPTGWLSVGPPESDLVASTRANCERFDLACDVLSAAEVRDRYPGYDLPDGFAGVYQHEAGLLHAERCVGAHVTAACAAGAEVHGRERVTDWHPTDDGVSVETDAGRYRADRLVVTAGAWADGTLELDGLVVPERQLAAWFGTDDPALFGRAEFPPGSVATGDGVYSASPSLERPGVKVTRFFSVDDPVDPDAFDREPTAEGESELRRFAREYLPGGAGPTLSLQTCMFTVSPDEDFVLDVHPDHDRVVFAAGFSGHGFSLAPAVGEALADLSTEGGTDRNVAPFGLDRFGP
jgi:sarcosine oxidase